MYEAFYNLKHKPFSLLPDPEFLFLSSKHAIALSLLEYSLSGQAGFCVITGEIGSGKTTLIRAFLNRIGREFTVGLISNTHSSLNDVSAWVLNAFGKKVTGSTPADTYQELMSFLISEYGAGRQCILILDEAQNLSVESLEELRLLSNINSGKDLLLQMVLSGQPQLLEKLRRPELVQFAQRISVSYHLLPLPFADTRRYVEHRLKVAGADRPIFSEMAVGAIQYFSGGVPRLINSICDMALVYGFADALEEIDEDLVLRVISDRQVSGIAPFARGDVVIDPKVRAEIRNLARPGQEAPAAAGPSLKGAPQSGANASIAGLRAEPTLAPRHVASQQAAPQQAAPQHVAPQPMAPQHMAPQHMAPQHMAPQHMAPQQPPQHLAPHPVAANHHVASPQVTEMRPTLNPTPLRAEPEVAVTTAEKFGAPAAERFRREEQVLPPADADDDELMLTTEVLDDALEESAPITLGRPDISLSVTAQSHPAEASSANAQVVRRSWQNQTADNPAKHWPSIKHDVTLEPQARETSSANQELGTTATPRRSWWRRSLSRGG